MAAAPLPRIPLSGTTDAAGTATIRFAAPAHFFAHATVAIQVAAGQASVTLANGRSSPLTDIRHIVLRVWVGETLRQLTMLETIDGSTSNALPALQEVPDSPPVLVYAITAAGGYRVSVSGYSRALL